MDWLIALQEEPGDQAVRFAHGNWLAADAENAKAWREAQHVWHVLGNARGKSANARARSGAPARRRRVPVRRSLAAAVLLAASLTAFVAARPMADIWLNADHITAAAETKRIELEDGSVAFLAPDSALDIAFETGERHIRLIAGQAFFDVKPDSTRPFVVTSEHAETRVLGTAFDMRDGPSGVSVAVERGTVEVSAPSASPSNTSRLQAGDWVSVSAEGELERGQAGADLVGTWRSGQLVVQDRPVAEVVETLARYLNARIYVADDLLASQRVTGVYDLNSPAAALDAVAAAYDARIRRFGPWLTVLSSR